MTLVLLVVFVQCGHYDYKLMYRMNYYDWNKGAGERFSGLEMRWRASELELQLYIVFI